MFPQNFTELKTRPVACPARSVGRLRHELDVTQTSTIVGGNLRSKRLCGRGFEARQLCLLLSTSGTASEEAKNRAVAAAFRALMEQSMGSQQMVRVARQVITVSRTAGSSRFPMRSGSRAALAESTHGGLVPVPTLALREGRAQT